jgi:hypothetical protein
VAPPLDTNSIELSNQPRAHRLVHRSFASCTDGCRATIWMGVRIASFRNVPVRLMRCRIRMLPAQSLFVKGFPRHRSNLRPRRVLASISRRFASPRARLHGMRSDTRSQSQRPHATLASGRITGRGHGRPRLYRRNNLSYHNWASNIPGVWGQRPQRARPDGRSLEDLSVTCRYRRYAGGLGLNKASRLRRCFTAAFNAEHEIICPLAPPGFQAALHCRSLSIGEDARLLGLQSLEQLALSPPGFRFEPLANPRGDCGQGVWTPTSTRMLMTRRPEFGGFSTLMRDSRLVTVGSPTPIIKPDM